MPQKSPSSLTRIYAISPSTAVPDDSPLERSRERLAQLGFELQYDRAASARDTRFAGSDSVRAAAFSRAAKSRASLIMITRGGYGLTRILSKLDYPALAAAGKQWLGISDFTAFHLAMLARADAVTWAGATVLSSFGVAKPVKFSIDSFVNAMSDGEQSIEFDGAGATGLALQGQLWGGNLAVLTSLLASPYFPQVKGGILFLEDIAEHPYRVERTLTQLLHAGVLDSQAAVLIGQFSRYRLAEHDRGFDMPDVLSWLRRQTKTPIISGLPFGHEPQCVTMPHGATVGLKQQHGKTRLSFTGAGVLLNERA